MAQVRITGNTFPVKDKLKAIGAKWDGSAWTISDQKVAEANRIVANAPVQSPPIPGTCRDCSKPCKTPYTICFACKAKQDQRTGKCAKCHETLNNWERNHGMRLCAECRDGGSRAHGGQSYHDRHGNFVLGDDD